MEHTTTVESPVGRLVLVSDGAALTAILFDDERPAGASGRGDRAGPFPQARQQLAEYFAGRRHEFDLPLVPEGTPFAHEVWTALRGIPYGETITYAELARRVGRQRKKN